MRNKRIHEYQVGTLDDLPIFKMHVDTLAARLVADSLIVCGTPDQLSPGDRARMANAVTLALMIIDETDTQVDLQLEQEKYKTEAA